METLFLIWIGLFVVVALDLFLVRWLRWRFPRRFGAQRRLAEKYHRPMQLLRDVSDAGLGTSGLDLGTNW